MTILKITVSKTVNVENPFGLKVYADDAVKALLTEDFWNDAVVAPEVFDEIRREIIECAFISELRVESVEVVEEVVAKTKEEKIAFSKEWDRRYEEGKSNGNSSGTVDGFDFSDAGEPG